MTTTKKAKKKLSEDIQDTDWNDAKKAKIRAWEQLHEIDVLEHLKQGWKDSKGPFTYQGGYINYHEWHSFFIGGGLIDLAFRLDEGAFIYFYILVGVKVLKDTGKTCEKPRDFVGELAKNFHYYIVAGFIAVVLWVELAHASPPEMTLGLAESISSLLE